MFSKIFPKVFILSCICVNIALNTEYGQNVDRKTDDPNGFPNHPMVVLTLDVSPSMQYHGRIQSLVVSTKRLIQSLPLGYVISIVTFGGQAKVSLVPTKISDDIISRQTITSGLPKVSTKIPGTSIGAGIKKALDVAEPYLKSGEYCPDMILVTDGEENTSPFIHDIDIQLRLKNICTKIHTIALGDDADIRLEALSYMTQGQVYFASDVNSLDKLTQNLIASSTAQLERNAKPILLPSKTLRLDDALPAASFQLDESIGGNDATFIISTANPAKVKAQLIAPNGDVYGVNNYTVDTELHQLAFKILKVQPGNWTVKLNSEDINSPKRGRRSSRFEIETATIYVTSYPSAEGDQPIRLEALLSNRILDNGGMQLSVEGHLHQGTSAILHAKIVCELYASNGTKTVIELLDNGAADKKKEDGIYTRYIPTHALIPGKRYQVEVSAFSDENGSTRKRSSEGDLDKIEYNFERQATAGSFRVGLEWKYIPLPPNTITDSCDNARACDPNEHLECKGGKCACVDGYALDETTNKCVKIPAHVKEDKKGEGVTLLDTVLYGIFGFILLVLLVGLGVFLWMHQRRCRRFHLGDAQ